MDVVEDIGIAQREIGVSEALVPDDSGILAVTGVDLAVALRLPIEAIRHGFDGVGLVGVEL